MAIKVQSELLDLIARIRTVSSPLERMRVLTDAWRTIRELSPDERKRLARFVGGKGADRILDRLGDRQGGLRPSDLRAAIARARRRQSVTLQDGVDLLEDLLRDEAGPEATPAKPEPEAASEKPPVPVFESEIPFEDAAGSRPPTVPPVLSTSAASAAAAAAVAAGARAARESVEEAATEAENPPAAEFEAAPEPGEEETPTEAAEPAPAVPEREEEPAAPRFVEERRSVPPRLPDLPPLPELPTAAIPEAVGLADLATAEGPAGRIAAAGRGDLRLRGLRRDLDEIRGLGDAALAEVVEAFPDGWERRRAIQSLMRAGIPASLEAALALLDRLAVASDRAWCALTLLDERADEPGASIRIAAAVPSSRVSRRARRSG